MAQRRSWLTDLRLRARLTQATLAHVVGVDPVTVSRWERGTQGIYERHHGPLADALGITPTELREHLLEPQVSHPLTVLTHDDLDRVTRAATQAAGNVDPQVISSLTTLLAEQRRTEDRIGSAPLLAPVAAQLQLVESLVVNARGPHRPALVDVAGQWAQFYAWLNTSVGSHRVARGWWDRAAEWATEADNRTLAANVLSFKGHLAWMHGQPGPTVGLSQAAQRDPAVQPSQRAYDAIQEARGHAMTGDASEVERKLDDGRQLIERASARPEDTAPWSYYYSDALYTAEVGLVRLHLSYHDPSHAPAAIAGLQAGLEGFGDDSDSSDWAAEWRYLTALAHVQHGNPTAAAAAAITAQKTAHATGFHRLLDALNDLNGLLLHRFPGEPAVNELAEAIAT